MGRETDGQLVAQAREGDLRAFEAIVNRYRGALVALAAGRLGSLADAEDVAQETLVRAFFRLDQLREPDRLLPWLRRLTERLALMRARSRREEPWAPERLDGIGSAGGDESEQLEALLEPLPPAMRQALALTYLAGYTCAEAAALLGVQEGTVKSRLSRARRMLKERFAMAQDEMKKRKPKDDFTNATVRRLMREARRLMERGDIEAAAMRADKAEGMRARAAFAAGLSPMEVPWDEEAAKMRAAALRDRRRKECQANAALYGYRLEDLDWELDEVSWLRNTLGTRTGKGRDWWGIPFSRQKVRVHEARDTMRRLRCSPQTLYGWVKQGMPTLRCWPFVRFDWDLMERWREANGITDWPKPSMRDLDRPIHLLLKALERGDLNAEQAEEIMDALGILAICIAI